MGNKKRIAALTIGQAPRKDLTPEISSYLGSEFEIREAGALDAYSQEEIVDRFSPKAEDDILVTRLRDGSEVIIGESYISNLLNQKIKELEKEDIALILLLCTGKFDGLESSRLLIEPQKILYSLLLNLGDKNFSVIIPSEMQKKQIRRFWDERGKNPLLKSASPYQEDDALLTAAEELKNEDIEFIYLDCMGYSGKMKKMLVEISSKKVILAREMISLIIKGFY